MGDISEVLVTSDTSANLWSSCVWDYNAGTSLHCYKAGGVTTPHTMAFIKNDYLIAAERLKPLLHIWPVNSQETVKNVKLVCSGRVSALAVSPDGCYCAAGIGEQLHVWQIAMGQLLAVASKHFQNITKVEFTSDGSHIISAGEDGLVLIWPLANLISQRDNFSAQSVAGQVDPLHTLSDHSLPVRDIHVGAGGLQARLVTVSADCTLKIYQLVSGSLLLSVVFDKCLTAVTMNASETTVFVGSADGNIYEFSLLNPPRNREYHVDSKKDKNLAIFTGHTKSISCISISVDGLTLASGSADEQVIIWHIPSKQKIRSIAHKGAITNVLFTLAMKNMFLNEFKPSLAFNSFQRSAILDQDLNEQIVEVIHSEDLRLPFSETIEVQVIKTNIATSPSVDHQLEIDKLKAINAKLYQFALDNIIEKSSKLKTDASDDDNLESTEDLLRLKTAKRKRKKSVK